MGILSHSRRSALPAGSSAESSTRLTAVERECIIGATDDDPTVRVYVDVPSHFARRLLNLARAWGVVPQRCGTGVEFALPRQAIRFAAPLSVRAVAQRREALQKARNGPGGARARGVSAPPAVRGAPDTGVGASPVQAGLFPQTPA